MNTNMLTNFQGVVHQASLLMLGIVMVAVLVALYKPHLLKKVSHEFTKRTYILISGAFLCLLCGTIFVATLPNNDNAYVSENKHEVTEMTATKPTPPNAPTETIKTEDITATEPVAYSKEQREDPALPAGQTKIAQAGKNGQKTVVYTLTYDTGKEVSRVVKSQTITIAPIAEITAAGTQTQAQSQANPQPDRKTPPSKREREQRSGLHIQFNCKNDGNNSRIRICL